MQHTININASADGSLIDKESPYYQRVLLSLYVSATTKFERVSYSHLGFSAWSDGKRKVKLRDGLYRYIGLLEPSMSAHAGIGPFELCLVNVGDSFLAVHVRLPGGMQACNISIMQPERTTKRVDSFIKYGDIWYATAVIGPLQTMRIES